MVVIVFRARLRAGVDEAQLGAVGERMAELAATMPGFLSYKDFASPDGESLTLVEFESEPALLAWRNHPEHLAAQARGREEFFADYHIQVCSPQREYRFLQAQGRQQLL